MRLACQAASVIELLSVVGKAICSGVQAVVQAAEESVEQVALGGGVTIAGGFASVVVGSGAG
jgi:galactitol-specific phosphotransferase system IIC component